MVVEHVTLEEMRRGCRNVVVGDVNGWSTVLTGFRDGRVACAIGGAEGIAG